MDIKTFVKLVIILVAAVIIYATISLTELTHYHSPRPVQLHGDTAEETKGRATSARQPALDTPPATGHPATEKHDGTESNETFSQVQRRMAERTATLARECGHSPAGRRERTAALEQAYERTQVMEKERLAVCTVFKAGSTTWNHFLARYFNQTKLLATGEVYRMIDVLRPSKKMFHEVIKSHQFEKALIVRHPLERLFSGYQEKIFHGSMDKWQTKNFVPLIFEHSRHINLSKEALFYPNKTLRIVPTFEEFVSYLSTVSPENYDPHWRPITLLCGLCHVSYTAVIHTDTYFDDLTYILSKSGFDNTTMLTALKNKINDSGHDTRTRLVAAYSTLDPSLLKYLLKVYQQDFLLLGYDPATVAPNVPITWRN